MILFHAHRALSPVVAVFGVGKLGFPRSKSNHTPILVFGDSWRGICIEVSSLAKHNGYAPRLPKMRSARLASASFRGDMAIGHKEPRNDDCE